MVFDISNTEWIALRACVMTQQKNKCAMCGKLLEDNEFSLHHIIPRAKGGKDELGNLIGLCDKCHDIVELRKLNREEIINYYEKYSLNDYNEHLVPIRKSYFMPETDNQIEYKYPKEIILREKYIIPVKKQKTPLLRTSIRKKYIGIIKERPNKYVLKYGTSLGDIAKIFGVSRATIYNWHRNEEKRKWMESILMNIPSQTVLGINKEHGVVWKRKIQLIDEPKKKNL